MKVLITDRAWPDLEIERDVLATVDAEVIESPNTEESTLAELARDVDGIGTCWAPVTANVIHAATRCRVISRFGIGLDNIDVAAATARGIPVTNVPDYCVEEVSDHTIALLLAAARRIAHFHRRMKGGEYDLSSAPVPKRLSQQTLGLVGFGRIGQAVYHKAQAFGLHVLAHSASNQDHATGCRMVSLQELIKASDFISLHAPLTAQTQSILNATAFQAMKPHAVVINTSRGGLIDTEALQAAIHDGSIGGAALDVFDPEPPDLSLPLYQDERVITTPHSAFTSEESLIQLRTRAAQNLADVLRGVRPAHIVNDV